MEERVEGGECGSVDGEPVEAEVSEVAEGVEEFAEADVGDAPAADHLQTLQLRPDLREGLQELVICTRIGHCADCLVWSGGRGPIWREWCRCRVVS